MAVKSKAKAEAIEYEREKRIASAMKTFDELKERLINVTAEEGDVIELQKASPHYLKLKREKIELEGKIKDAGEELVNTGQEAENARQLLDQIDVELREAMMTKKEKMNSSLVHESTQEIVTGELVIRLKKKFHGVTDEVSEFEIIERQTKTEIKNLKDDLNVLEEDIAIENGPLMQKILKDKVIRCAGLNASNTAENDVTGSSTGGVQHVVTCEDRHIFIHDLINGVLRCIFGGDGQGKLHIGEPWGHTSIITCVYFRSSKVYTGSMDNTIMCWDIGGKEDEGKRLFIARGHDATVTCIYSDDIKLISGSADKSIIIWNKDTGEMIRRVVGHSRGILCIQSGPTWCVSGGTDGDIFVWENRDHHDDPDYESFKYKHRLRCPKCKITAIQFGQLEIISGDNHGWVSIWWIKTSENMRRCQAHHGPVTGLQFDATRVVSCGNDKNVQVIDIITGQILQTLRGHKAPVTAVVFDSKMILSSSVDGILRQWMWGSKSSCGRGDKIHTFQVGETLPNLSQKYDVAIPDIFKWNGIADTKKMYQGQKLIVRKGNTDLPTAAELAAQKKSQRKQERESRVLGMNMKDGHNLTTTVETALLGTVHPNINREILISSHLEIDQENIISSNMVEGSWGMSLASRLCRIQSDSTKKSTTKLHSD